MTISYSISEVLKVIRRHGFLRVVSLVPKNIAHQVRWYWDRSFDREHGTDTSQVIPLERLTIAGSNAEHGVYYEPTSTRLFRFMMRRLVIRYQDYSFIDFGSGKGRTLLLASEYPFKAVVGVEFSKELHDSAMNNISVFRSVRKYCHCISSVYMDAIDYPLPLGDLVIYLYNPFRKELMARILDNVRRSLEAHPRKVVIIYFGTVSGYLFDQQSFLPWKANLHLPYDWTRHAQRKACVYSNHPRVLK